MANLTCVRCGAHDGFRAADACRRCGLRKEEEIYMHADYRRQRHEYASYKQLQEMQMLRPPKIDAESLRANIGVPGAFGATGPVGATKQLWPVTVDLTLTKPEPTPLEWLNQEVGRYIGVAFT